PGVNTEITQTEVGSTEFSSRNFSDIGDTGTTAYINNNEGRAFPYKEKNVLDKYRLIGCPCRV
ncbi:MAG: hypothetical protein LBR91_02965, partial [Puniceicoccales bacterium]|nr:hypothetical protein [Puniceicoccales bacterium]